MTESRRSLLVLVGLVLTIGGASQWWGYRQEQALARELARQARDGDILMLASDRCGYCERARRFMRGHGIAFSECSIERDAACAARFKAVGGGGTPTLLVRGEAQLGFDPERVLRRLSRDG